MLCIQGFQGYGYSSDFASNLGKVKKLLYEDDPNVAIITDIDDICALCPNYSMGRCKEFGSEVIGMDKKVLEITGIENGTIITFKEAIGKINDAFRGNEKV